MINIGQMGHMGRMGDAMVLYEWDAELKAPKIQTQASADALLDEVRAQVGDFKPSSTRTELLETLSRLPFTKVLHPDWARYYYMAMLSCSTFVVVFDDAWWDSVFCEGEWHLFER